MYVICLSICIWISGIWVKLEQVVYWWADFNTLGIMFVQYYFNPSHAYKMINCLAQHLKQIFFEASMLLTKLKLEDRNLSRLYINNTIYWLTESRLLFWYWVIMSSSLFQSESIHPVYLEVGSKFGECRHTFRRS